MALALMLPTSTLAATGYTFTIANQHCISGGHNIGFEVRLTAAGSTPANKLTIKSTSQHLSAGKWHNFYYWKTNTANFTANGQPHSIDWYYDHVNNSDPHRWRIVSVLKALHGKHLLKSKTLTSKAC